VLCGAGGPGRRLASGRDPRRHEDRPRHQPGRVPPACPAAVGPGAVRPAAEPGGRLLLSGRSVLLARKARRGARVDHAAAVDQRHPAGRVRRRDPAVPRARHRLAGLAACGGAGVRAVADRAEPAGLRLGAGAAERDAAVDHRSAGTCRAGWVGGHGAHAGLPRRAVRGGGRPVQRDQRGGNRRRAGSAGDLPARRAAAGAPVASHGVVGPRGAARHGLVACPARAVRQVRSVVPALHRERFDDDVRDRPVQYPARDRGLARQPGYRRAAVAARRLSHLDRIAACHRHRPGSRARPDRPGQPPHAAPAFPGVAPAHRCLRRRDRLGQRARQSARPRHRHHHQRPARAAAELRQVRRADPAADRARAGQPARPGCPGAAARGPDRRRGRRHRPGGAAGLRQRAVGARLVPQRPRVLDQRGRLAEPARWQLRGAGGTGCSVRPVHVGQPARRHPAAAVRGGLGRQSAGRDRLGRQHQAA